MLGKKLGKYEILQWLGGGRFGDVYLARDEILDQNFALKVARPREFEMAMLKTEARLLCALNHPHIVRFHNVDIIEGQAVLILEYVAGRSLREIIRTGGIEIDLIIGIARQAADALGYAHGQGVWHRDLKPENILLTGDHEIKIADFGLARFARSRLPEEGAAGTPLYMPPEAWAGRYEERSDIWGLGVVLYELLTGEPPFLDDDLARLRKKIAKGSFIVPSLVRAGIPGDLEDLVAACLRTDIAARPSADEVGAALTRYGRGVAAAAGFMPPDQENTGFDLSPDQAQAIADLDRQILLLGQAGCGKTTTLIQGIIKLIGSGVRPDEILAVTFTNKAARDIKERLKKLRSVPEAELWLGTCHNLALKILRRDAERIDQPADFTILDPKTIMSRSGLGTGRHRDRAVLQFIEGLKAKGQGPADYLPDNDWEASCLDVYRRYEEYCQEHEVMDYDDLIRFAVRLLEEHADRRKYYQDRFRHIFLDELQDFNPAQYRLVTLLVRDSCFFTGDPDQAIYGWRGAERELVYRVVRDFPDTTTITLNRSFRVPQAMFEAAGRLLKRTTPVIPNPDPGDVYVYAASSEADEGKYVAAEIGNLRTEGYRFQDIAVLFRINALSRIYEEGLTRAGIPYALISGAGWRDRANLKPIFDYLDLLAEAGPDNGPQEVAVLKGGPDPKAVEAMYQRHAAAAGQRAVRDLIEDIAALVPFPDEDLKALRSWIGGLTDLTIRQFLNELKLMEELDVVNWHQDEVKLLTMHGAKGLEFPAVFVTDLTEDIIPLAKSALSARDLEEERRLCYVAITRAQRKLFLVYPKSRRGRSEVPSRFLLDMFRRDA